MNKQNKYSKQENIDDEQIEKTLNFFDSILDPYLKDEEVMEKKSDQQLIPTNSLAIQQIKYNSNGIPSKKVHNISAPLSSSSPQRPAYIHCRNKHEKYPIAIPTSNVRRYTSENNLNQLSPVLKPKRLSQKPSLPEHNRESAVSTDDLSTVPTWKNFSRHTRLSALTDKTSGTSASLIDLTSLDKISASRPRYRFIPPTTTDLVLKEEPEIEQQQRSKTKSDPFYLKPTSSNQVKHAHKIIKPTVIIPAKPKSAPVARLTETNIQHQQNNSAFKPLRSNKNGSSAKIHPTPINHSKRTEPHHKPNVHIGITNSSNHLVNNNEFLHNHHHHNRHRQNAPQFHQSMLNLSSAGIPDTRNSKMFESRVLYQPAASNFIRSPNYLPKSSKPSNRHYQYPPPPPLPPPPPTLFDDRRIPQVQDSSYMNGLVYPSYYSPYMNGGGERGNRYQQQIPPYNLYASPSSGLSSPRTYDYLRRQQPYLNPIKVNKHHSPRNPASVQSAFLTSLPASENGFYPVSSSNIYHFNQTTSSNDEQLAHDPYHKNFHITTYL
ncbi:hypothetical protein I4U23_013188 [Adineta vaga]|nr:hypothetical protein I4U23_013188 [Adineta vaga]